VERTFVEISRQKLTENYQAIRRVVGGAVEILAVVKADAYGHGAVEVCRTLEAAGARWFAVTSVREGIHLRRHGIGGRVVVLSDPDGTELDALAEFELTVMLHSLDQLQELEAWARGRQVCFRFHLEIDSGMGRLGLDETELPSLAGVLARSPYLRLEGLATHFASAENFTGGQTEEQIRRFACAAEKLAAAGIRPRFLHMANSAALAYRPETWGSMVRPGLALYGYLMPPRGKPAAPLFEPQPILSWKARVLTVREYAAGVPLGYDAAFRTSAPMRVGVIAAGYADGLDRRLSNGGIVLAGGRRTPIVGLVSMDVCLIDLSGAPEIGPGSYVTLLGREGSEAVDAAQMAERCHTIPYDILCGIRARVKRVYR
jgi:alanine racemase